MSNIHYSCGYCGELLGLDLTVVLNPPEDYDAREYPHEVCKACRSSLENETYQVVTREMALDAGDLSLEGMRI